MLPPAAQVMERATPSRVQAAIEALGSSVTIRLKLTNFTEQSSGYKSTVAGAVAIESEAGKQPFSLEFSSTDRHKGQMSAKIRTADLARCSSNTSGKVAVSWASPSPTSTTLPPAH